MIWDMNAEELINIANKRLCRQASAETREVVRRICVLVIQNCPEFENELVPACARNGRCYEMKPCGAFSWGHENGGVKIPVISLDKLPEIVKINDDDCKINDCDWKKANGWHPDPVGEKGPKGVIEEPGVEIVGDWKEKENDKKRDG